MENNNSNKYICQYCKRNFNKKFAFTRHIRAKHLGIKYKLSKHDGGFYQKVKCEKCGREITKACYQRHYNSCDGSGKIGYIPNKKTSKYIKDGLFICECGKSFKNGMNLGHHFCSCKIHRSINGLKLRKSTKGKPFFGKSEYKRKEFAKKSGNTLKKRIIEGKIIPANLGNHHSQESKDKIRLGTIKYLQKNPNFHGPRYNKKACEYIDELNKKNNWNLIHALNGKEECIYGYFVDGYDKDLNIVFEYDESKHYKDVYNNILKEKDLIRQQQIIDKIKCQFYRYNEKLDLFYKVN